LRRRVAGLRQHCPSGDAGAQGVHEIAAIDGSALVSGHGTSSLTLYFCVLPHTIVPPPRRHNKTGSPLRPMKWGCHALQSA
jgi:hypothetical protein